MSGPALPQAGAPPPGRRALWVAAVVALAMGGTSARRWSVSTDITHFLPSGTDHALATISRQLADSTLTRTLILSVGAPDREAARLGATTITERLLRHPEVAWVQRGPTPALAEAVYRLYASRLPYFISDRPESDIPAALGVGVGPQALAMWGGGRWLLGSVAVVMVGGAVLGWRGARLSAREVDNIGASI